MSPQVPPESASSVAGDSPAGDSSPQPESPAAPLLRQLAELHEWILHYVAARSDLVKAKVRRIAAMAAAGVALAAVGIATFVKAVFLILEGLAGGAAQVLGISPWTGQLLVGAVIIGGASLVACAAAAGWLRSTRRGSIRRYDDRRSRQRARFGHDIGERSRETSPSQ